MSADTPDRVVDVRGWPEPVDYLTVSTYDGHLSATATVAAGDLFTPRVDHHVDPEEAVNEFSVALGRFTAYLSHEQAQRLHEQLADALHQAHDATHTHEETP